MANTLNEFLAGSTTKKWCQQGQLSPIGCQRRGIERTVQLPEGRAAHDTFETTAQQHTAATGVLGS